MIRIGHGYDAHAFAPERDLILGGVHVPHHQGLAGHSDADVLLHAICDALLGAAALDDIGGMFPDSNPAYKNINSRKLLIEVVKKINELNLTINNIDTTIIAQSPKLAPFIPTMRDNIAHDCGLSPQQVNIKATTTERMGFTGREEGIAVHAVTLLEETH